MAGKYDDSPSDAEYAVYGVLCAAKHETGPSGARRLFRIQMRLTHFTDIEVERALIGLMIRGWVRKLDPIMGMIHYEVTAWPESTTNATPNDHDPATTAPEPTGTEPTTPASKRHLTRSTGG